MLKKEGALLRLAAMEQVQNEDKLKNFEKQFSRLQAIVQELESETLALEKGMALYREGMLCSKDCREMLENAKHQLQKWQNGEEASLQLEIEDTVRAQSASDDSIPF